MKDVFSPLLKEAGFKDNNDPRLDVRAWYKHDDPKEQVYAEVCKMGTSNVWYYVWIVGKGVPSKGGYPGGVVTDDVNKLKEILQSLSSPSTKNND